MAKFHVRPVDVFKVFNEPTMSCTHLKSWFKRFFSPNLGDVVFMKVFAYFIPGKFLLILI